MEQQFAHIQSKICELRGQKVMFDFDLARLYGVETKALNQAVKRNIKRFPLDFMFQLTNKENDALLSQFSIINEDDSRRSQFVTASTNCDSDSYSYKILESNRSQIVTGSLQKHRNEKYLPYAFTEQGIAMLSGVLKSDRAIETNIIIMRSFIVLRQYALGYAKLNQKLEEFMIETNVQFSDVFQALTELTEQKQIAEKPRNPLGYIAIHEARIKAEEEKIQKH